MRHALELTGHNQVVVVTGDSTTGTGSTLTEFDRTAAGWVQHGSAVRVWNGRSGWAYNPLTNGGYSPIGVFTLGAAGGYAPNPGTRYAYQYSPSYYGLVYNGVRTFNHVMAIGYNHVDGSYPSDPRKPKGSRYSYGVWMHTSHNSPSRGCVGIPDNVLVDTMRWMNPAAKPVIVMGPRSTVTGS
jgi:L,D-peptidoglycan transpeptidase YkuD (ErfK/YbiS/YcfS/YnhG family)